MIYFSGYGHTKRQAESVLQGVKARSGVEASLIAIDQDGNLDGQSWDNLKSAKAIIFGSPTDMGGPAWQFKKFADASSKQWAAGEWRNKIAAGFTNSASINGDKFSTISYFITLAMQHSMIWVGTGMMPANNKASTRDDVNWLAGFSGALAQSPADASPAESPSAGDLETARLFGERVAELASKL